ncbi:MAG: YtxH domain-containing protein [Gemmatimonadota bacterium]
MRDREDPYIVIEQKGGSGVGSFLIGALVGAGLALLFTPYSGEETQEEIKERARRLKSAAGDQIRTAQKNIEERIDHTRDEIMDRVGTVREAVESGRQAARDARSDLEHKLERSKAAYRAGVEAARETAEEGGEDPVQGL